MSNINWQSVVSATVFAVKWKRRMESEKELLKTVTGSKVRWALRRDSLPLATIRKAWLKSRKSLSVDTQVWRRGVTEIAQRVVELKMGGEPMAIAVSQGAGIMTSKENTALVTRPTTDYIKLVDLVTGLNSLAVEIPTKDLCGYDDEEYMIIDKRQDTEKHSCSSHKHLPVVGVEPTALETESRVAAHCANRCSITLLIEVKIRLAL
ncbi:jg12346 [Pararge aegeria aegeria]|uniref:Jg12346 protein n=1 Tax=Pararge aegeria aegeria TaxID=348720 RepID=A0A8S4R8F9_9NEOP|nr:jg12346 [Pararge aegeria aegeria]